VNSGVNVTKVGNYDTHIADNDIHVTTSDKTTWNNKQNALTAQTSLINGLYKISTNTLGQVTVGNEVVKADITALGIPAQDTTYSVATTSVNGLMSALDKTKLDSLESTPALIKKVYSVSDTSYKITVTKDCTLSAYKWSDGTAYTITPTSLIENTEATITVTSGDASDICFSLQ